jgi:hypothetical protein
MKIALGEIDEQIREVENRIAVERIALDEAVNGCTNSLREAVTSPKTLLALLGVGFAVGKILFREKAEHTTAPAKKAGVLGLLTGVAGTALSLAGGSRGGWGSIARWAAGKYLARRKAAHAIPAPMTSPPRTVAPLRPGAAPTPTAPRSYPTTRAGV